MTAGRPIRRDLEWVRHGTVTFMGAYDVRRGKLSGFFSETHESATLVQWLDMVDSVYPPGDGHLICDNLSAHDTDEVWEWLEDHPR